MKYVPDARWSPNLIPFRSLMWNDEVTPGETTVYTGHDACLDSLIRLTFARKQLWLAGQISQELQPFWREAQEIIPNWPGFRRLTLTAEELWGLESCDQEAEELMKHLSRNASVFTLTHEGGGVVSFMADPPASPPTVSRNRIDWSAAPNSLKSARPFLAKETPWAS